MRNLFTKTNILVSLIIGLLIIGFVSLSTTADTVSPVALSVSAAFDEWKVLDAKAKLAEDKIKQMKADLATAESELNELITKEVQPKEEYITSQGYIIDEKTMSLKEKSVVDEVTSF